MSKAAKSAKVIAVRPQNKSIANIDAELAKEVATLKDQIGQPSGRALKIKPTGAISTPEGLELGSEIQIVVLDFVSRNSFYPHPYDGNNPTPPSCYAIGKNIAEMKPESDSPEIQNADGCVSCPLNVFGSGNNGKSKACKNTRDIAVLIVDPDNAEAHNAPDAPIYTVSLPPTAIRSFDGAVANVARALGGGPIKAILTMRAENVGTYASISFHDPLPNPNYAEHFARRVECVDLLFRKPDFAAYQAKAPVRRGPAARPAPQRAAGGRR